jgi:glycosyltransferase involved in cell wall biosynthesis
MGGHGRPITFISTQKWEPWGGSEELWWQAAMRLHSDGIPVSMCVPMWSPTDAHIKTSINAGIDVFQAPWHCSFWDRAIGRLWRVDNRNKSLERWLRAQNPSLVVIGDGMAIPSIDHLRLCSTYPFVTVSQSNHELWWVSDDMSDQYRLLLDKALRCYFVSAGNLKLFESQIAHSLPHAEIVRNPFGVSFDWFPQWPTIGSLQLACVGRLDPASKGQDILLEALATPAWSDRDWHLNFYGAGRVRQGLERIAARFGLSNRVTFCGFEPVKKIWNENHVLVLPSRYEGLPIVIVEAMICGRPVVTTDVAGNCEFIEDGITGFIAKFPKAECVSEALERLWLCRNDLPKIGMEAARRIRELVPEDPVALFSMKLRELVATLRKT